MNAKTEPVSERLRLAPISRHPDAIHFGRDIAGDLLAAEQREWLVTNGIGGFASGTMAGNLTRRYHGLLFAALKPPSGRTLLVTKLDETAHYDGESYALAANRWAGGAIEPQGFRNIESFRLDGTTPVWSFACGDALIEKRIWMEQGSNTTYLRYELARGRAPVELTLKALVNYRDYHSTTHAGDWHMEVSQVKNGLRVLAYEGSTPFYLLSQRATGESAHDWFRNFDLVLERYRGLDDHEDHLHAGTFRAVVAPGESATIVLTTEATAGFDGESAWGRQAAHEQALLDRWRAAQPQVSKESPAWIKQLVLAAGQFIVRRPLPEDAEALSMIAGYHWFCDWGRDTMIALPGLTLTTGRPEVARKILSTFARFVDRGMLPNVFPDAGETPEYNTVDATLWYFEALRQCWEATRDAEFLDRLYPVLAEIIDWHVRGTRFNIHVDPADGLLFAGEPGVQLTWMDAKVGDWVVTPRIGKPVEVNALWYNALHSMAKFANALGKDAAAYASMAERVREGFQRFWSDSARCCFDVIDGPDGSDSSLRPNQIFAVSLPESPVSPEQQRAVVDTCARHLLTSHGLRSLSPRSPQYRGHYGGSPRERDASYHQGTVWGWLLGPFALAHLRVYKDAELAMSFLSSMADQLRIHGLGTLSEIFDGDAPFAPRGCIAQAWTVAEVLRAWTALATVSGDSKTPTARG